jgi:phosphoribosylglycinamide formyltransferase-1
MQGAVAVSDKDTPDTLAERVLEVEHRIYPAALRLLAAGLVRLEGGICITEANTGSGNFLISPVG